jgi:putative ABC transport system permease protein
MNVSLAGTRYESERRQAAYFREALSRLRAAPGVVSAGGVDFLPLASTVYMAARFSVDSGPAVPATVVTATPDYFRTMGTQVLFGREFTEDDRPETERVAVVNEAFASEAGGGEKLVGKQLVSRMSKTPWRVIGIVRGARYRGPSSAAGPQIFEAAGQRSPAFMTLVARVDNARARLAMARDAVQSIDAQVPVFGARTLADHLRDTLARPRFYTETILFLGAFALLLSVIGVYAVSAYSIAQRTHEIGVRMAIGAPASSVRSMLMRQSLMPVAIGAVIGIPAALGSGRYLSHLLASVQPPGVATCAWATLFLASVSAIAVWSAIARVIRSNPLDALRSE